MSQPLDADQRLALVRAMASTPFAGMIPRPTPRTVDSLTVDQVVEWLGELAIVLSDVALRAGCAERELAELRAQRDAARAWLSGPS